MAGSSETSGFAMSLYSTLKKSMAATLERVRRGDECAVYREDPADGGSGQIDCEDCPDDVVCGGAGQTD
jgi:hypothetical protein